MNYFKGSVAEAILEAKKKNEIFIVFIYDKSELSKNTREELKKEELTQIFSTVKYIAIEIENGSQDAIQFAQIYPLIVVPSLFFINPQNGVPLEVMAGNVDINTLADKVKKISTSVNKDVPSTSAVESNPAENSNAESNPIQEKEIEQNKVETDETVPADVSNSLNSIESSEVQESVCADVQESVQASTNEASGVPEPVPEPVESNIAIEERVQRAQDLISQRQEQKQNEDLEDEKRKELERRRQSSEVAKAKQNREEQERIELGRQRKKDKEEDRLARERVKAQIAADRAERLARISILKGEEIPAVVAPPKEPSAVINQQPQLRNRNVITRIKFRFPDNSSELSQFSTESTLREVQTHLIESGRVPFAKFKMVGTLPPRTFTENDMPMSLIHLGLTPSAIIIVKPVASDSTSLEPIRKSVILFLWSMFSPFLMLYQYLSGYLGIGTSGESARTERASDDEDAQSSKRPRTEGSYTTRNRPKTAYGQREEGGAYMRREGNVHRLNQGGDDEDDDENNTWNGNSTQQM